MQKMQEVISKGMSEKLICPKCGERFFRVGFNFCPFDGTPIKWEKDENWFDYNQESIL